MNASTGALKVYYCYAEQDEKLRDQLTAHLSPLRRERKLTIWLDILIQAGANWKLEVEKQLIEADVILLLISPHFMASDYCYNLQLTAALNHYEAGKVNIIPILLRPVLWEGTPIKRLPLILPTTRLPVTLWRNRDEAFKNIAIGIRDVVQAKLSSRRSLPVDEMDVLNQLGEAVLVTRCPLCGTPNRIGARFCKKDGTDLTSSSIIVAPKPLSPLQSKEKWIQEGQLFFGQKQYADALAAYEQALLLDPCFASAYFCKGNVLYLVGRHAEALAAYEQALRFNPDSAATHCHKGHVLRHLSRYPEALAAYEQALQHGSLDVCAHAWSGKGHIFYGLKQYAEALAAFEHSSQLSPSYAEPHVGKGNVLHVLQQYSEAITAYEQASQLDSHYAAPYFFKGNVFYDLKQYAEALAAYEQALKIDPRYAAAYHGKGRVYETLGIEEEAKVAFGKAADLNSTSL